jgi:RNA-directed DNA polymerase
LFFAQRLEDCLAEVSQQSQVGLITPPSAETTLVQGADKLVQTTAAQILSAIYEQDFRPCRHGYRRGKGPQRAALELSQRLQSGKFGWIIDADIKGFFDHIDHDWLMKMLEQRINNQSFLNLIRKLLKAGILEEDGKVIYPLTGTPQGGVISPTSTCAMHWICGLRRSSCPSVWAM